MVYVDPLMESGGSSSPRCFRGKPSCHMYADSVEDLHVMAAMIGLKYEWFQDSPVLQHYDLTVPKRALAIRHGAVEQNFRQAAATWKELRRVKAGSRP